MAVEFLPDSRFNDGRETVDFVALADGRRVECRVSAEALMDSFGGDFEDQMENFRTHRQSIEAAARRRIIEQQFEPDGSIVLTTRDRLK